MVDDIRPLMAEVAVVMGTVTISICLLLCGLTCLQRSDIAVAPNRTGDGNTFV